MKNRIDMLDKSKKHLVIYLMAGDPDIKTTEKLVYQLAAGGVSLIELGVPFTDPMADGVSIQRAGERALKNRVTMKNVLALSARIRKKISTSLVLMTYYNLIYNYGGRKFVDDAKKAGVDGAIIPDLPFDEERDFYRYAVEKDFYLIYLVSPANGQARIKKIVEKTKGFVYYILLKGVTGARNKSEADFSNIKSIRKYSKKPVFAGFGISKPSHVKEALKQADGAIIGSAFVDIISRYGSNKTRLFRETGGFIKKFMKEALNAKKR
jgi:tryptophan synthase alpha chain